MSPEEAAGQIRPHIDEAKNARGRQDKEHPARVASDAINAVILRYDKAGGNLTSLARELEGELSLATLRRRVRVARADRPIGGAVRSHGSKDPDEVAAAAERIVDARGTKGYGAAIAREYDAGINLRAVAKIMGVSYHSLYITMMGSS